MRRLTRFLGALALLTQGVRAFTNETATVIKISGPDVPPPEDIPAWLNSTWTDTVSESSVISFSTNSSNSTNSSSGGWGNNPHTNVDPNQKQYIGSVGGIVGLGLELKSAFDLRSAIKNYDVLGAVVKSWGAVFVNIGGTFLIGLGCYMTELVPDDYSWIIALAIGNALLFAQNAAIAFYTNEPDDVKHLGDRERGVVREQVQQRHQDEPDEAQPRQQQIQQPLMGEENNFSLKQINSMLKTAAGSTLVISILAGAGTGLLFAFLKGESGAQAAIKGLLVSATTDTGLTTLSFLTTKRALKDEKGTLEQNHYVVPR